jgi:hypothetical protein
MIPQGHDLEEIVDAGWAPSTRWLQDRLRCGTIRGRKVGRHWKLSDADVEALVESLGNGHSSPAPVVEVDDAPLSLTLARSRRRVTA